MKTFSDLQFQPHPISRDMNKIIESLREDVSNSKQAIMEFENGYGVSVIIGKLFYSNGIDTYEVGVLKGDSLCYDSGITDDVIGRISADEVTEIMKKVQQLQKQ